MKLEFACPRPNMLERSTIISNQKMPTGLQEQEESTKLAARMVSLETARLEQRCSAIQFDRARASRPGNGVGLEALTVCHVAAEDSLILMHSHPIHQIQIDREAAFIIHAASGDRGAMNLRFEQMHLHGDKKRATRTA